LQRISQLFEKSGAAQLGFTLAEFEQLLTEVTTRFLGGVPDARLQAGFIETLHVDELVLARACARGNEGAWRRFVAFYRDKLYRAAAAITHDDCAGRELADSLYADLFGARVAQDGRRASKLEFYGGRGSLEGWLRTVLAQEHVNRLRMEHKFVPFDEAIGPQRAVELDLPSAESNLLTTATDAALAALSDDDRFLLAAHYLDGRTLAVIGRMLNLHESSVSRRLEKLLASLRKRIVANLRSVGLTKREAEDILHSDVRDLSIDVRERLAQGRHA
jgi:RNA polymerase sigma-70 factor, ECF subfamily